MRHGSPSSTEPFYDFTAQRPLRRRVNEESTVRWPTARFYVAEPEGAGRHFVLVSGREPSLRWQMFVEAVADLAGVVRASTCLRIGTWGAATPHTRPAPVDLSNADPECEKLFGPQSRTPTYQGPTGISTVLNAHLRSLGVRTGQLSALVPHYIGAVNPKAVLALVETLDRGFGTSTPAEPISSTIDDFDAQAREAIEQADEPAGTWRSRAGAGRVVRRERGGEPAARPGFAVRASAKRRAAL